MTHDFEIQEEGVVYRMTVELLPLEQGSRELRIAEVLEAWDAETLHPLELTPEHTSMARYAAERRASYLLKVMNSLTPHES